MGVLRHRALALFLLCVRYLQLSSWNIFNPFEIFSHFMKYFQPLLHLPAAAAQPARLEPAADGEGDRQQGTQPRHTDQVEYFWSSQNIFTPHEIFSPGRRSLTPSRVSCLPAQLSWPSSVSPPCLQLTVWPLPSLPSSLLWRQVTYLVARTTLEIAGLGHWIIHDVLSYQRVIRDQGSMFSMDKH